MDRDPTTTGSKEEPPWEINQIQLPKEPIHGVVPVRDIDLRQKRIRDAQDLKILPPTRIQPLRRCNEKLADWTIAEKLKAPDVPQLLDNDVKSSAVCGWRMTGSCVLRWRRQTKKAADIQVKASLAHDIAAVTVKFLLHREQELIQRRNARDRV